MAPHPAALSVRADKEQHVPSTTFRRNWLCRLKARKEPARRRRLLLESLETRALLALVITDDPSTHLDANFVQTALSPLATKSDTAPATANSPGVGFGSGRSGHLAVDS